MNPVLQALKTLVEGVDDPAFVAVNEGCVAMAVWLNQQMSEPGSDPQQQEVL